MNLVETEQRKRDQAAAQAQRIQGFKEGVFPPSQALVINRLTKFDYLVNVLLGRFLCSHKPKFLPKGGFAQGHCRPKFCLNSRWSYFQKHQDKSYSLTDCISFVVMRDENINTAFAFDHHFVQAGFSKKP